MEQLVTIKQTQYLLAYLGYTTIENRELKGEFQ